LICGRDKIFFFFSNVQIGSQVHLPTCPAETDVSFSRDNTAGTLCQPLTYI
jgi:hypothetical protein